MKVLFVCRGNVARSQLAAAIYNKQTQSNNASSAGTQVNNPGEKLIDRKKRIGSSNAVDVLKDYGLFHPSQEQTQLTKSMLENYDLIISMAAKRYTPKWLVDNPKYQYWKIQDPKARGYNFTDKTKQIIESKILDMLSNK